MATFYILASSSSGNSALYIDGKARILIDAGVSTRYIAGKLKELSLSLSSLTHILITHAHSDHVSALPVMLKHTQAEVLCPEGAHPYLPCEVENLSLFTPGECFSLAGCPVCSFATPHDVASAGFVLGEGEKSVALCTDLGHMPDEVLSQLKRAKTVMLESNHDVEMLKSGPYPYFLKQRVLSSRGHLSNEMCAGALTTLYQSGARRFILAHLSRTNNTPEHAFFETDRRLRQLDRDGADVMVAGPKGLAPILV